MKTLLLIISCFLLLLIGTSATAEMKVLTDEQLDRVTAGTFPENGQVNANQNVNANVRSKISNDNLDALNVVNFSEIVSSNNTSDDDQVNHIILKDGAQLNARAFNIVNNISGKVGNALNFNVNKGLEDRKSVV